MKIYYAAALALVLSGCATSTGLYNWGGYDALLYKSYKSPETAEANVQKLEAHVLSLEHAKQKVAPGLYADLGTMFLQAGNREKALLNFAKERDTWPESRALMDAMIKNSEKAKNTAEAKT